MVFELRTRGDRRGSEARWRRAVRGASFAPLRSPDGKMVMYSLTERGCELLAATLVPERMG
jgi:hypothetical protein